MKRYILFFQQIPIKYLIPVLCSFILSVQAFALQESNKPVLPVQNKSETPAPLPSDQTAPETPSDQYTPKPEFPIEVNADNVEYIKEKETVKGKGNVVINFKGVKLAADSVTVNLLTKDAYADGNVRIYQADRLYTAEHAYYNFNTEQGKFENTKGLFKPFYLRGSIVNKPANKTEYHIQNGYVTTSDYSLPDYRLKAKTIDVYPNDKIILRNIVFEVAGVPILWFPYWYYPLTERDAPFSIVPGYSKRWGVYLLNSAQIYRSENLKVSVAADYRQKHGLAAGIDADYNFAQKIKGMFKSYFLDDKHFEKFDQHFDGSEEVKNIHKKRYRLTWEHEQKITSDTRLLSELNLQSDRQIIDDFFQREFEEQIQRVNFLDVTKATEKCQVEVYVAPRLNSFFDVLERLPQVRFMTKEKNVFNSPVFFTSDIRAEELRFLFDDEDLDFDAFRLSSQNQLSLPLYLWNFLNFTPYVKGDSIMYSDVREGDDKMRGVVTLGFNSDFRVSKIYNVESTNWNIHGLRHVFEPTMDFKLVRSNMRPEEVFQFDLIDSAVHDTAISFKFRNLLQTIRQREETQLAKDEHGRAIVQHKGLEEASKDLVDFSISFDVFPTKANRDTFAIGHANREFQDLNALDFFFRRNIYLGSPYISSIKDKYLSELLFDMKFSPFDWLSTSLIARYDPFKEQIEELTWGVSFYNSDKISWDVYTSFFLGGSTQLSHTFSYRINDDWRLRISHILDFNRDSDAGGIIEYQRYTLIKDLHEWELAFSFSDRRYERVHKVIDRSFFVVFYLKDFPNIRLKLGN